MPGSITARVTFGVTSFLRPRTAGWLALCMGLGPCCLPVATAQDHPFDDTALGANRPASTEVTRLVLPSLDDPMAWGGAGQSPSFGGGTNATEHIDITRWLTPDAPRSLGFSLGLSSAAPSASTLAPPVPAAPTRLDLGVRWRSRLDSGRHLHVAAWAQAPQRAQPPDALGMIWQTQPQPVYGTRVEVQWASSRTHGLVPEFGAVGVQLQSGSRLVLRAKKGGPMLYYRAKF